MGRAPCCDKANVKRGPWSPEEDVKLKSYIEKHGTGGNWIALPQKIGLKRCGKSCRLRWLNYLRPNIKHGGFTEDEDNLICSLYISIGSRWSIIAAQLPGRTDNDIKNYWNTRLKKKLLGRQRREQIREPKKNIDDQYCSNFSLFSRPPPPPENSISYMTNNISIVPQVTETRFSYYDDHPQIIIPNNGENNLCHTPEVLFAQNQEMSKNSILDPSANYSFQAFDQQVLEDLMYVMPQQLMDGQDHGFSKVEMVDSCLVYNPCDAEVCDQGKMTQDQWGFLDEPKLIGYSK